MATKNLQSAQTIAVLFNLTTAQVETLRRHKVITGEGSPKQYDLLPTIQSYIKHLQNENKYCTAAELADIFGFDGSRRIEQLKADGIIVGEGKPTRYVLIDAAKRYIAHLSEKAHGREKRETDTQLETGKLSAEKRIKEAKAEMAELELAELRGQLHRAEDVEAITTDHVLFLRSMLMAIPGKLAVDLSGNHTAAEQSERVKREIHYVLDRLANYKYDPEEYKRRVMERQGWELKSKEDEDG